MFHDREGAARQLAAMLRGLVLTKPLVLAIPRGGIVTGAALAGEIRAELDVVLTRKLRSPDQPDLAFGAISEDGAVYVDENTAEASGVTDEYFHGETQYQLRAMTSHKQSIRSVRPKASIQNRSVIVTDDGISTGSTMIAALQTVRAQNPLELIAAVPVAPEDRLHDLEMHCDQVVCLLPSHHFCSVGQFYEEFPTVEDEQLLKILRTFAPQAA